jgi:cleavage and polyadenylation specificity factor subunit 1
MQLLAVIEGVDCLSPVLSVEPPKRSNIRETVTEFVVADLGDPSILSPYLIVRTVPRGHLIDIIFWFSDSG